MRVEGDERAHQPGLDQQSVALGILIGDRGAHWPLARCFTGANDGKVAVARARLEGMADFRVVDCGHAFIMRDRRVQELVVRFLRAGEFGADDGL